jgi:hypothetical protein
VPNWRIPTRALPHFTGESPFRVKGHGLRARMAVYDRVVPGGKDAVLAAIEDPAFRAYLSGPILAASWYDLFAHVALDIAAADVRRMSPFESVMTASSLQAEADARGIYSWLLKLVSPQVLVKKLGAISSQYFDHGSVVVERLDATAARMTRSGITNQLYWWWGGILEGYVKTLFRIAGATGTQTYIGPLVTEKPEDGLGIGSFVVEVRWEPGR